MKEKLRKKYYSIRFKVKHLRNLLVRLFTNDNYYVCEECHHIHKRDGQELRLDEECEGSKLMSHYLWYGSVNRECFIKQQQEVRKLLRDAIFGK